MKKITSEKSQLHLQLRDKIQKISELTPRNIKKRLAHQKGKNEQLTAQLENAACENSHLQESNQN